MTAWLVGENAERWTEHGWYFIGVFESEEVARRLAEREGYEVAAIELNAQYEANCWPQFVGEELKKKSAAKGPREDIWGVSAK